MLIGSILQIYPFDFKPSAPPVGSFLFYMKTDNTLYLQDSAGTEYPFGSTGFISSLTGDVTTTGSGAAVATVAFVGGQTAANVALAVLAYQAATSSNVVSTIVKRDASGNFSAGTITAALIGNASTATFATTAGSAGSFSGSLAGDVTGTQSATVVSFVGGQSAAAVAAAIGIVGAATSSNVASTLVKRDASGNFAANQITASTFIGNLTGNASGSASSFTGALLGDVTGTQGATVVSLVGGQTAAAVAAATAIVAAATSSNTASTLVKRDASGNFSAGIISAALNGNATTSTTSVNFTGTLGGDVTGTQGATVVSQVGGKTASDIASAVSAVDAATSTNTASTLVERDASGNFAAGTISAALIGNVTGNVSGTASNITGLLAIINGGTNSAAALANNRIMISAGGAIVESSALTAHRALISNASGLPAVSVTTDAELAFVSGVTSSIQTQLNSITGSGITSLTGDVTGTGPGATATTISTNVVTNTKLAQMPTFTLKGNNTGATANATDLTISQVVTMLGTITALTGDVSASGPGSSSSTVNSVGGSSAANIHSAELAANAATSSNVASTIVKRGASGEFSMGALTASSATFTGVSDIIQAVVKGFAGQASDIFQVQKSDSTVFFKIDSSGNAVVLGTITASNFSGSSSGTNTGDATLAPVGSTPNANAAVFTGQVLTLEPADGTHPGVLTAIAQIIGGVKTFLAQLLVNDTTQSTTTATGSIVTAGGIGVAKNINAGGNIAATGTLSGSNFSGSSSGTNTGDVTKTDTDSIALSLTGQNLSANLKLSTDAADTNNIKMTSTIHSGAGAGLHVEVPFGTPVNIGTTNATGSDTAIALRDHVHAITFGVVGGLIMSTYVIGTNAAISAADSIVGAFGKLQAQINAIIGSAITSLTGDVTGTGPGATATTISTGAVTDTKASLAVKPSATVVATTNQTKTGTPTIDGQATTAGTSIILLTAQTTGSENGPWIAQTGAWTRPTWYPSGGTTQAFQFITTMVRLGTVYGGSEWRQTAAAPITIDTTATTWAVVPVKGNFNSIYTVGPQTGSSEVDLVWSNANQATLAWNPTSTFKLLMPPTVPSSGQYLSASDNAGTLAWTNPLVNIDGGAPDSNYVASQVVNGGTP